MVPVFTTPAMNQLIQAFAAHLKEVKMRSPNTIERYVEGGLIYPPIGDLRATSLASWRSQLGVVFQDSFLFDATLRENIALGRPGATEDEVRAAARAAGVEAIDCPYTFSDVRGAAAEARQAKRLGYRAKSLVTPAHAAGPARLAKVSGREYWASREAGGTTIRLFLWRKRLASLKGRAPRGTILIDGSGAVVLRDHQPDPAGGRQRPDHVLVERLHRPLIDADAGLPFPALALDRHHPRERGVGVGDGDRDRREGDAGGRGQALIGAHRLAEVAGAAAEEAIDAAGQAGDVALGGGADAEPPARAQAGAQRPVVRAAGDDPGEQRQVPVGLAGQARHQPLDHRHRIGADQRAGQAPGQLERLEVAAARALGPGQRDPAVGDGAQPRLALAHQRVVRRDHPRRRRAEPIDARRHRDRAIERGGAIHQLGQGDAGERGHRSARLRM